MYGASAISYSCVMGSTSHLTPGEYSLTFNDFLLKVVVTQGGVPTARWAEINMPSARGKSYWEKLLKKTQSMTTEDIALIASWLEMDPFVFVRAVRTDDIHLVPKFAQLPVSGSEDDGITPISIEEERELRRRKRAAKTGVPKSDQ